MHQHNGLHLSLMWGSLVSCGRLSIGQLPYLHQTAEVANGRVPCRSANADPPYQTESPDSASPPSKPRNAPTSPGPVCYHRSKFGLHPAPPPC